MTSARGAGLAVSVVVPTFRRNDLLARCLHALLRQQFDPAQYEIIVCDDAASPACAQVVAEIAARARVPVHYLAVTATQGPAGARNRGWERARGEIIAFTDDDTIPDARWLAHGLAVFAAADAVGAWGRIVVPLPPAPSDYERDTAGLEVAEAATANCFYRRAALVTCGGFDERFRAAWREDADLYFTMLALGRVLRVPDAVVVHPVRPGRFGISLQQQRKAQFNALLYKKHPRLYRERIQARPPWHYYGMVALLAGANAALIADATALAAGLGAAWLVLVLRFCAFRLRHTRRTPMHVLEMLWTSMWIPPLSVYWRLRGALRYRVPFL